MYRPNAVIVPRAYIIPLASCVYADRLALPCRTRALVNRDRDPRGSEAVARKTPQTYFVRYSSKSPTPESKSLAVKTQFPIRHIFFYILSCISNSTPTVLYTPAVCVLFFVVFSPLHPTAVECVYLFIFFFTVISLLSTVSVDTNRGIHYNIIGKSLKAVRTSCLRVTY